MVEIDRRGGPGRCGPASGGSAAGRPRSPATWPRSPCRARRWAISVGDDPGDDVEFRLAANAGVPPLPLAKVASGGELARTMLALRLVLTEAPDTLIFDEVDAGIGGSAAIAVGRSLAELGTPHQVLVVTHLAQVARRWPITHLVVSKHEPTAAPSPASPGRRRGARRRGARACCRAGAASKAARHHAEELLLGALRARKR